MKSLVFVLCLALITTFSFGQTAGVITSSKAGDAIANAGTSGITVDLGTNAYSVASFHIVITKVSGTVAGTTVLQASNDKTNWQTIGDTTLTHTNSTTNHLLWKVVAPAYSFYRTLSTGSGTMNATPRLYTRLTLAK